MIEVNVEKFLADYNAKLEEKATKMVGKDEAIKAEIEKVEKIVAENGFSDKIKETLITEVREEKEKDFDFTDLDNEIAEFEKYIKIVEDEKVEEEIKEENAEIAENVEVAENDKTVEDVVSEAQEVKRDIFGNIIG